MTGVPLGLSGYLVTGVPLGLSDYLVTGVPLGLSGYGAAITSSSAKSFAMGTSEN